MTNDALLDTTIARLSPEARRLLFILTRGGDDVPEAFVEKVWSGVSLADEKVARLGRLVTALEGLSPDEPSAEPALPSAVRARLASADARAPRGAPPLDELVQTNLVSRRVSRYDLSDVRFSFTEEVARAASRWMEERPEERGERDERAIRAAFGERYGAAFAKGVEGALLHVDDAEIVAMGIVAAEALVSGGAFEALAAMLGDAVRVAKDADLVGPVVFFLEREGALSAVMEAFRASGDGLGAAGTFAALAGHHRALGDVEQAIALESRALEPLGGVVNSVIPRAIVHLRLSGDLLTRGRSAEAASHHLAALAYRVLVHSAPRAELAELRERRERDPSYELPVQTLAEDPILGDVVQFMRDRSIPFSRVESGVREASARPSLR